MRTLSVQAFRFDELPDKVRERLTEQAARDAWEGWAHHEAGEMLHDRLTIPGLASVEVPAWALYYYSGAVVEAEVVDAEAFADALGFPDYCIGGDALRIEPYYSVGVYPGHSSVIRCDGDYGETVDAELTDALRRLADAAVAEVEHYFGSDDYREGLTEHLADWWYDADGRRLGHVDDVTPAEVTP